MTTGRINQIRPSREPPRRPGRHPPRGAEQAYRGRGARRTRPGEGGASVPAAPPGPSLLPPLNFPERGPRQAPGAHREARFGAGTYCSKRRRTGAARPLGGTRTGRTPRNLRWKGNQRSTIHRSQRRWRPKWPPVPSRPDGGSAQRPSDIRTGGDTKPGRGRSTRSRSATGGGRGAQTGMEDGRGVCSKQGATPQGPFRGVTRRGCLTGTPFRSHPPEDTRWEARWATPQGPLRGVSAVGIPTEWRFPSDEHPPEDTRWEARWGGTISTPTSGRLRDRKPISTSWLRTKRSIQTPLLYIHRPILGKNFHGKHKGGVFTPEGTLFCMGKAILHTKP